MPPDKAGRSQTPYLAEVGSAEMVKGVDVRPALLMGCVRQLLMRPSATDRGTCHAGVCPFCALAGAESSKHLKRTAQSTR